ncbi:MAG: hypothetical protein AB1431_07115 [Pseudomonadota bacterium]
MREKIARAICGRDVSRRIAADWTSQLLQDVDRLVGELIDREWCNYLDDADAALSALETPTPDMVEAGQAVDGTITAEDVWSAMIRKAKEG